MLLETARSTEEKVKFEKRTNTITVTAKVNNQHLHMRQNELTDTDAVNEFFHPVLPRGSGNKSQDI